MRILLLLLCLGLSLPSATAQTLARYVIGNGGGTVVAGGGAQLRSTIGQQTAIGIADAGANGQFRAGFWYVYNATVSGGILARLNLFLAGPYSGGTMGTGLLAGGFIPLAQPYNTTPWNYAGPESVTTVPADVVDWVLIALRTGTDAASEVARRAAFVKADGTIVDLDGTSDVQFDGLADGTYYVVLDHRNHLPAMTAAGVNAGVSAPCTGLYCYDFTSAATFGTAGQIDLGGGAFGLWGGDGNRDASVSAFDFLTVWLPENGSPAGYKYSDFNMDSNVSAFDFLTVFLPANGQSSQVPN